MHNHQVREFEEKLKVMLTWEDGFIMSKRQQQTLKDGVVWLFAKSPGTPAGLLSATTVFEEHGYEVVDWDDDQECLGT